MQRKVYFGGPGTAWWAQMASVIIGGLVFASVLTLLLTPSILMIQGRIQERRKARRAARSGTSAPGTGPGRLLPDT
jgi:multidrug efflux pump